MIPLWDLLEEETCKRIDAHSQKKEPSVLKRSIAARHVVSFPTTAPAILAISTCLCLSFILFS
jgi:hypothetical protein